MTGDRRAGSGDDARTVAQLADRSPGAEPARPYEGVSVAALPEWWRDAVEEFRDHDMRPYRPSRFEDGAIKQFVVDRLEATLDVTVRFVGRGDSYDRERAVLVDGTEIATVEHRRLPEGYTEYCTTSAEFVARVRDGVLEEHSQR
ncbi:hypothetical protein [Halomicrobium salinisoli]|uniref:hypothetical protein n=1 Tax=Halomicrobium salinisoli TaxID=2878391 RepID=UPI001CF051AD|nr:hypothetical protein [Halomicrobium salinisoli]